MSKDRRAVGLKVAASMLRRQGTSERVVSAKELVEYARTLDAYMYDGTVPGERVEVDLAVEGG